MTPGLLVSIIFGILGVPGTYFGYRALRRATASDQRNAVTEMDGKIDKARSEGRDEATARCEMRVASLQTQMESKDNQAKDLVKDRDYWRSEHNRLRALIDDRGLKE